MDAVNALMIQWFNNVARDETGRRSQSVPASRRLAGYNHVRLRDYNYR